MNNEAKKLLNDFFKLVSEEVHKEEPIEILEETMLPEVLVEIPEKKIEESVYTPLGVFGVDTKETDPSKNYATMGDLQKHYGNFLSKIQQQMSTMGGGGEVKLRYLDDVDRSSIVDEGYLNYNASTGKFVFSKLQSVTTVSVTDASYTLTDTDSYIGVNYAGAVEITLPSVGVVNGRLLYVKDESGAAETNPITVIGTVDNDAGGFILQINNGSITLIYRDGWRIV